MRVAVVGATGMVGEIMLQVLAERNFPVTELIPVASEKSVGKRIFPNIASPRRNYDAIRYRTIVKANCPYLNQYILLT